MAFCSNCGNELKEKVKFCPNCGVEVGKVVKESKKEVKIDETISKVLDTEDTTSKFTKKDTSENMGLAIFSYVGLLALVPYFTGKHSKFVMYHAKQGMNLLIVWGFYTILYSLLSLIKVSKGLYGFQGNIYGYVKVTPWWINFPMTLIGIGIAIISIIGIVYVCQGKAKELPIINKIKIVK